jgi:hypothetical protein
MEQVNNIPIQVLIDVVHPNNKWELVCIQNSQMNRFIIKKGVYYYNINDMSIFRNHRFIVKPEENSVSVCLGEFRPLVADMMYLTLLPISFNGNEYIVNIRTKIVYIKPRNITLMLAKNTEYNFETFKNYFYGGIYNPYLNSENHTGQIFLKMLPSAVQKIIPDNIQNRYNRQMEYDEVQRTKSLLGDKMLLKNDYVAMREPQKFVVHLEDTVTGVDRITFIVPFLEKHHNNYEQLVKTLWSIVNNVEKKEIFLVTNKAGIELPADLIGHVNIYEYKFYVGSVGYENRLNVMMRNGYDLCNFYNSIIGYLVKTDSYIVWQYNWELVDKWNVSEVNVSIPVYNHYVFNGKGYKSKSYVLGHLADNRKRYSNTPDFMNIYIHGVNNVVTNVISPIKCVYSESDYADMKNSVTYDNNREVKDFYEKMGKDEVPEYIITNQ